ncbi:DUF4450 domain-containing protein [Niabella insulamsoli]|uniref:DUF4450 domain-containing protein n=1 Tax=Niabella insulamsoli TaxID=3144874 RepID=UPI0031FC5178
MNISSLYRPLLSAILYLSLWYPAIAQEPSALWHNKERTLHYKPEGKDFILHKGTKKFNRALYGGNTAFRVEAGDLPEFALYMPGMGGNCKIGIVVNGKSKWLAEAAEIKAIYRPGAMLYEIKDPMFPKGFVQITVLALSEVEGMIIKMETKTLPANTSAIIAYGGASGKKFSRDGDIGADPESSFYLQPAYCTDNQYRINKNRFTLYYGFTKPLSDDERYEIQYAAPDSTKKDNAKLLSGVFPLNSLLKTVDAAQQQTPLSFLNSGTSKTPALAAVLPLASSADYYFLVQKDISHISYAQAPKIFARAEKARQEIANRVNVETPDPYINTLGSALAIAADAIWEAPSFLHGAVAWRMRLPAWRGAYAADALGWQNRARLHFDSYLKSQVTKIAAGPVTPDTALHFARQLEKMGTAMFSNGYICRSPDGKIQPHHYDMNLIFFDQLLTHLNYTGDTSYAKKIWPALKLHLEWEKRNFDSDNDGLYDAYACIWASDALQYSGGGVTHSTAYNYRAHKTAAAIARLINEDASPYEAEALKISTALNTKLWIAEKGVFAENRDRLGLQLAHISPGLWTIYHAIDEGIASREQKFEMLRYVDRHIPHIPVQARDFPFKNLFLLATTNWQPYTWSVNNVALAENLHTALAYWQSGENDNAFQLWKSALLESMYLSSSPGGFQQLSFYDAVRGELYRDFADPIGMTARTLTEGLFGIKPDALKNTLRIEPGFPEDWQFASLNLPHIRIDFKQSGHTSTYDIRQQFPQLLKLRLQIEARSTDPEVYVNGEKAGYTWLDNALHQPVIVIQSGAQQIHNIKIVWRGERLEKIPTAMTVVAGEHFHLSFPGEKILAIKDTRQSVLTQSNQGNTVTCMAQQEGTSHVFLTLQKGKIIWTAPIVITVLPQLTIKKIDRAPSNKMAIQIKNNSSRIKQGALSVNGYRQTLQLNGGANVVLELPSEQLHMGTNSIKIYWDDGTVSTKNITDWDLKASGKYEAVDINRFLNENIVNTFQHKYLSPRAESVTLQIPWQGIGNWCYPLVQPGITDAGLKNKDQLYLDKIPFAIGSTNNIAYTSQWDQFPDSIGIPLAGKASHAYILMAGTTNHQQSQITNGLITINYTDGSKDTLALINPENWWPIEQDYRNDGFAFQSGPKPYRLIFKTGLFTKDYESYTTIKGFSDRIIEGGAGTVLDLPLDSQKELQSLTLKTLANEVLTGIMSLTLQRD